MPYLYHWGVPRRQPLVEVTPLSGAMPIRTGPTTAIPSLFTAFVDDPVQPLLVQMKVKTVAGQRPEVSELHLESRGRVNAEGLTTAGLRRVRIAQALKLALAKATVRVSDEGDGLLKLTEDPRGTAWRGEPVARPVRGEPVTEEFLGLVAKTYRAAVASGSRSPVEDLRQQIGGSRSTAGRWVVQARKAGVLRPAIGRKSGEVAPKVRAKRGQKE
jgi:hypothetical protein